MLKLALPLYVVFSFVIVVRCGDECHPWSFYNDTVQKCQCYKTPDLPYYYGGRTYRDFMVQCSEKNVLMNVAFCMTNEEAGTFIGDCGVYSFNQNATLVDGIYTELPENISELNDYMCGPMNRKGRICSKCIDGFAPSFTGFGYECANCTGVWYGVPLYLFLEFVPITLFYLAVLVLQISVTSSPLTYCVMYSQFAVYRTTLSIRNQVHLKSAIDLKLLKVLMTFHGVFNLDFFRYIFPPFCISHHLKSIIQIYFLAYVSALYPLLLIALTWLSVQLYSYNFQPLVWLWNKLSCLRTNKDSKSTIVDIFATFFLLSYTKLCFTSMMCFKLSKIFNANGNVFTVVSGDSTVLVFSFKYIPYAVMGVLVLVVIGVLPALLMAVYPFRILRSIFLINCLSGRSKAALDIFVEKFYSCYRDGLDGGRDMRSFASLHLFIGLLTPLVSIFAYPTLFFGGCCLLILLVKPCKYAYMNNTDALILALLALNCYQLDKIHFNSTYSDFYRYSLLVTASIPLLFTCANLIPQRYLTKVWRKSTKFPICKLFCCIKHKEIRRRELSDVGDSGTDGTADPPSGGDESEDSENDALLHN